MRLTKPGEVSSLPRSEADTGGAWGLDRKTDLRATFLHPWPVQQLRIDRCSFLSGPSLLLSPARGGRWEGWSLPVSCASHLWDKSSSGVGGSQSVCPLPPLPAGRWGFGCWRGPLGRRRDPQLGTVPEECTRAWGRPPQKGGVSLVESHCSHDGKGS